MKTLLSVLLAVSCAAQQPRCYDQPAGDGCNTETVCGSSITRSALLCEDPLGHPPSLQQPTNIQHADSTPHSEKASCEAYKSLARVTLIESNMILECVKARTCVAELEKYHYELEAARNALEVAGLRQCNDETPAPNTLTLTYDEVELLAGLLNQFHIPNGTTAMRELAGKIEKLIGGPKQ